ncbi:MAG: hypothetical protein QM704_21565 [Anaeromyxobacteraceae bacterium]
MVGRTELPGLDYLWSAFERYCPNDPAAVDMMLDGAPRDVLDEVHTVSMRLLENDATDLRAVADFAARLGKTAPTEAARLAGFLKAILPVRTIRMPLHPVDQDGSVYELRISGGDSHDKAQVRVVASALGVSLMVAAKMMKDAGPVVVRDKAAQLMRVRRALAATGLQCDVTPAFPYPEPGEEWFTRGSVL